MSKRRHRHRPLGPGGSWKTGQRVPTEGWWADQYGLVTWHARGSTFPPCLGRKKGDTVEGAFRRLVREAAATA